MIDLLKCTPVVVLCLEGEHENYNKFETHSEARASQGCT